MGSTLSKMTFDVFVIGKMILAILCLTFTQYIIYCFIFIFSNVWPHLDVGSVMLGMDRMVFASPVFWLGLLIIPAITIIPDFIFVV